ncbi:SPOR domain-containing protein [Ciceribacter sp. L1K23]|uniref:SPOR domain-containing protein n=1 Tax=Ciceribacter sp. L1K23 TaxID=2820276 RepID=UPI001B8296AB|nr:SPOR domain-containing protein [Ciceribacter sp. L1K23]MBR0555814.1 SPOR domain-containing protein [Ciceribacter sp. L1K23]
MVKHQAALQGGFGGDSFADDDPLAELARIVGFEPASQPPVAPKVEPAFDLEEELLREFETFEEPAPAPEVAVAEERPAYESVEPSFDEPVEAEPAFQTPLTAEPDYRSLAWETVDTGTAALEPEVEPRDEDVLATYAFEDRFAPQDDLATELEWAIAEPQEEPAPVSPVSFDQVAIEPEPPVAPAPRLNLPIANFAAKPTPREPVFEDAPVSAPAAPSLSLEDELAAAFGWALPQPAASHTEPAPEVYPAVDDHRVEPSVEPDWAQPRFAEPEVAATVANEPAPADTLADFSAFDMPFEADAPEEPAAPRREPDFDMSFAQAPETEVVAEVEALPFVSQSAPDQTPPSLEAEIVAGWQQAPQTVPAAEPVIDPLHDGEFELDLEDLELDLSDFSLDDEAEIAAATPANAGSSAAAISASFAPVAAAAVTTPARAFNPPPSAVTPVAPQSAPQPVSRANPVASMPVAARSEPTVTAAAPMPVRPAVETRGPASLMDEPLPFDPREISEQDDLPSAIPALDVPEIPAPEPVEPPVYRAEYDIDLDSELATLFADTAVAEPQQPAQAAVAPAPAASRPATASGPVENFDEFEKALEEDFRETLGQAHANPARQATRVVIEREEEPAGRSGGRRLLLAASVALIAVLAAGGGYVWLTGTGSGVIASGEPPVILADKDPVKIVPENPGGTAVPNQDKAVYDRVEGAVEDPKQESLISGSEEPVDVVQKTLLPETLPLEGENDSLLAQTPVGETEDPRLLPGSQPEEPAAASTEPEAVAIAPRKVRTMIVRADGTLVAQDIDEPAPQTTSPTAPALAQPSATQTAAAPVEAAPAVEAPAATPAATETVAAAATAPETTAPAQTTQTDSAPAEVATSAPVPVTRPAQQPVDVVSTVTDQGNVRPAPATETQTPASTSTEAAQPAAPAAVASEFYVQIASLPSEAEAQRSYQSLSSRYAGVIGGKGVDIKRADIEGKGTYYRVRIPGGSRAEAISLCERYKAAGGSCLVAR